MDPQTDHQQDVQQKYEEVHQKRRRADANEQYIEPSQHLELRHLVADPWIDPAHPADSVKDVLPDGYCRALILGAGPGALALASRLIATANFRPQDVCVVDSAGGPGGTWYWNRYPGLMCDVESYVYLPMLEETGYMPKHKYSYGGEIREYSEHVVRHFGFKALYQSVISSMDWDDATSQWMTSIIQHRSGQEPNHVRIRSQFVAIASGTLSHPKIPRWPGLNDFKGDVFHTARWNYNVTGGSPDNWDLEKLKDKVVGFVGTGATAVQAMAHLTKWSKKLYVFQRTPSAVNVRGQRETDPESWLQMTSKPGWVADRHYNMMSAMTDAPEHRPAIDLVNDGWTGFHAYASLVGGPVGGEMTDIEAISGMYAAQDFVRSERVRARVDEIVHDKETAERLKAYYPGYCKRPCFHDNYLNQFNEPNVVLVDTDGKGVESLTKTGIVANGVNYPVDVLICGTGYRAPTQQAHARANMHINGRNGASFEQKVTENWSTLHGVITRDFPNLLLTGASQAAASPSITYIFDEQARHIAHILREAERRVGSPNFTVEPTAEAENIWTQRIQGGARNFVAIQGCLPSYINEEGTRRSNTMEEGMQMARAAIWGKGCNDWVNIIRQWRDETDLKGLEVELLS